MALKPIAGKVWTHDGVLPDGAVCLMADAIAALTLTRQQHAEQIAEKDRSFTAVMLSINAERDSWREDLAASESREAALRAELDQAQKCRHGHEWSNKFGEDWTPKDYHRCDCGAKPWAQRSTVEMLKREIETLKQEQGK